jgi:hypothetical protein
MSAASAQSAIEAVRKAFCCVSKGFIGIVREHQALGVIVELAGAAVVVGRDV